MKKQFNPQDFFTEIAERLDLPEVPMDIDDLIEELRRWEQRIIKHAFWASSDGCLNAVREIAKAILDEDDYGGGYGTLIGDIRYEMKNRQGGTNS